MSCLLGTSSDCMFDFNNYINSKQLTSKFHFMHKFVNCNRSSDRQQTIKCFPETSTTFGNNICTCTEETYSIHTNGTICCSMVKEETSTHFEYMNGSFKDMQQAMSVGQMQQGKYAAVWSHIISQLYTQRLPFYHLKELKPYSYPEPAEGALSCIILRNRCPSDR